MSTQIGEIFKTIKNECWCSKFYLHINWIYLLTILTEDIATQYGMIHLFKMDKIVIASFVSDNGSFTNLQNILTLPVRYRPNQTIEISITSSSSTPSSIDIFENGNVVLMTNEVLRLIRFQAVWHTA